MQTLPTAMKAADADAISITRPIARIIRVIQSRVPATAFPSPTPGLLSAGMAATEVSNQQLGNMYN